MIFFSGLNSSFPCANGTNYFQYYNCVCIFVRLRYVVRLIARVKSVTTLIKDILCVMLSVCIIVCIGVGEKNSEIVINDKHWLLIS